MTAQEHLLRATKRAVNEFGSGHRIAGLIVLLVVAIFGTMQWMHSGSNAATLDSAQQESPVGSAPTAVEYFPAQYVNQAQATQPEKPSETF
jgi:hypothetical protein